jgi:ABC-type cobalamin transport system ATPase subunit
MKRFLLIGQKGSTDLLLIDTTTNSVQVVSQSAVDPVVAQMRASGTTIIRDVDVAIATDSQDQAVGRFYFTGN